jgi:uncharacterized protein (TIGR02598 family)
MKKLTSGFSLIEVTIALGIAAFSLVSILGVMPVGLSTSASAKRQTEAVNIMSSVTADIRSAATSGTSSRYKIVLDSGDATTLYFSGPEKYTAAATTASQYRIAVTPYSPPAGQRRATWARVRVTWPVSANSNCLQSAVETSLSLDRN